MPPKGTSASSPVKKKAGNDRPSSPTSLLFNHQFKREHGFLLQKVNALESSIKTMERNTKKNDSNHDIAAIAEEVKALTNGGDIQRVRKEVMKNIENLQGDLEAVVLQVSELTRQNEQNLEWRKKQFDNEKKMLKRVKEVEEELARRQKLLEELGDRVSEEKMDVIKADLAEMMEKVQGEDAENRRIGEKLRVLEEVARVLKEDNKKLTAEVRELRERAIAAPANDLHGGAIATDKHAGDGKTKTAKKAPPKRKAKAEIAAASETTAPATSQKPRTKQFERELAALQETQGPQQNRKARIPSAVIKKTAVRKGKGWVEVEESTQEESALAAAPVLPQDPAETAKAGRRAAKVVPTTEEPLKRGPGRPRKDASQEGNGSTTAPKRGPGRPRKNVTQASQAPPKPAPKRRTIKQDDDKDEPETQTQPPQQVAKPTRKRQADTLLDEFISPPQLTRTARPQPPKLAPAGAKKKPQLRRRQAKEEDDDPPPKEVKKGARRGLTNVYDEMSPISSSMDEEETQEAFGPPPVELMEPPRKRRQIKQDFHDEELLRRISHGVV